jgi:hypothetical protein
MQQHWQSVVQRKAVAQETRSAANLRERKQKKEKEKVKHHTRTAGGGRMYAKHARQCSHQKYKY